MQPSYSSIGQIFSTQMRYVVPLFQRPYVWSHEHQWQPLWDDIEELANRVLDPPAHKPVAGHFLGTAVLENVHVQAVAMPQRRIIDGQQRLTTLQILIKASVAALSEAASESDESERMAFDQSAGRLRMLCENQYADSDEARFKVWPTNDDRPQFRTVLEWMEGSPLPSGSRMAEAFNFFRHSVTTWLGINRSALRASALAAALADHVKMIVLDLDPYDEPQAIFETLNAHGTPLLPADLIKNWLLWEAGKQNLDATPLYEKYWHEFDRDHEYWRKVVGTGHAARPRVDTFLQNWLILQTGAAVSPKHIYDRFLSYAATFRDEGGGLFDLPAFMERLWKDAALFRSIDGATVAGEVGERIRRLNKLDYIVFRPFMVGLLRYLDDNPALVRDGIASLESFLVRRMVCGEQTRAYSVMSVDLAKTLWTSTEPDEIRSAISLTLTGAGWPDDERFAYSWKRSRFYRYFRQARVLTLLQAMERELQLQATKSEKLLVSVEDLTIEHVMPQTWQTHWPLPEEIEPLARDAIVQNIGNLTLVNGGLNPSLSNNAWSEVPNCKRDQLATHSKLELNRHLLQFAGANWDEAKIEARAGWLFNLAKDIWPAPPAPLEEPEPVGKSEGAVTE